MSETLKAMEKVEGLKAVLGQRPLVELVLSEFQSTQESQRRGIFASSNLGGSIFLYRCGLPAAKGYLLEYVASIGEGEAADSMSTLYEPTHPAVENAGKLLAVREGLIKAFCLITGTDPYVLINDQERNRGVRLQEMSTMQIVGLMKERFKQKGL